ncbi:hypothetical protein BJ973_001987 [Actinoplanes tereljensis]|uniref:MFS transporter n=1 Tax=Paractinoplanes tereljensis TaxID=571912 RepID=A0A919TTK4_9ACTN|nr:hypothetical protein [Actinoplanes tereljensis]GIF20107.1 hypothetical protein Ate02nite_28370 [Actinoplanes tereljensis]
MLFLVAISRHPIVLALAWAGVGATGTISSIVLTMARLRAVPDAAIGKVVSAAAVVTDGAAPLGAIIAGYALTVAGPATTAWIIFTIMAILAVSYARLLPPLGETAKPPRRAASDL